MTLHCSRGFEQLLNPTRVDCLDIVDLHTNAYFEAGTRNEKIRLARTVVDTVKELGRFLNIDKKARSWVEVSDNVARQKVCQAFQYHRRRDSPIVRLNDVGERSGPQRAWVAPSFQSNSLGIYAQLRNVASFSQRSQPASVSEWQHNAPGRGSASDSFRSITTGTPGHFPVGYNVPTNRGSFQGIHPSMQAVSSNVHTQAFGSVNNSQASQATNVPIQGIYPIAPGAAAFNPYLNATFAPHLSSAAQSQFAPAHSDVGAGININTEPFSTESQLPPNDVSESKQESDSEFLSIIQALSQGAHYRLQDDSDEQGSEPP